MKGTAYEGQVPIGTTTTLLTSVEPLTGEDSPLALDLNAWEGAERRLALLVCAEEAADLTPGKVDALRGASLELSLLK